MKATFALFVLVLPLFAAPCIASDAVAKRGEEISSRFIASLQQELVSAIGKGGAVNAIEVCSNKAFTFHNLYYFFALFRTSAKWKHRNDISKPPISHFFYCS